MTTLKDVAEYVGVSVQTVSNVVNGRDVVHPKTRDRILEALDTLNYHPNAAARGLRRRRSQIIGFLVVDPSPRYLADPFHSEVVTGIADVAREHNYGLLIQGALLDEVNVPPKKFLQPFQQKRIDGGVITLAGPSTLRQRYLEQILNTKRPFVLLEQKIEGANAACILGENRQGAFEAAEHLIQKGHRQISFLTGNVAWPAIEERIVGYREALWANQLEDKELFTYCDWTAQSAFEATTRLLADHPGVTAILGANDVLAVGALQAIQSADREVPNDIAVIGFDDFDFARYVRPQLTTVRLPGYKMGQQAAELLLEHFKTKHFPVHQIQLPASLVIRESS